MRRLSLAISAVSAVAFAQVASAADVPRSAAPFMPPPPVITWTGFYFGFNAGVGLPADSNTAVSTTNISSIGGLNGNIGAAVAALGTGSISAGNSGFFIGGGQIGYNWQLSPNWVTGLEADFQGTSHNNSSSTIPTAAVVPGSGLTATNVGFITASKELDYIGTVRARLGYLVSPTWLPYVTGGFAYGKVKSSTAISERLFFSDTPDPFGTSGSLSETRTGWTVGGGVEWRFWQNWSAKAEYLYYDLGTVTYNSPNILQFGDFGSTLETVSAVQTTTRFNGSILRAGVNYHF